MSKPASGVYHPENPSRYIGNNIGNIKYRSGWELTLMKFLDSDSRGESILGWGSECVSIPYRNPLTNKWSMYIPDFVVIYIDKDGQKHCDMIEIKPEKETPGFGGRVDKRTKLVQAINFAKWQAAIAYCAKRGWRFRVATEKQLFAYNRKS